MKEEYFKALRKNKLEYPLEQRWRVEEIEHDHYFVVDGNTFAVDNDGTISGISRRHASKLKGKDILAQAVQNGGNKLQSFGEKLYIFYTKNGFKPVCRVQFDARYAPVGCTGEDTLILYIYTGKVCTLPFETFLSITEPIGSYEKAKAYRDFIQKDYPHIS